MTMRLWCRPGVTFELGRLKVLIAPPDRMAALLDLPEIGSFHTLYLFHGFSEVLFRVPPIRSEHFETEVCTSLDDAIAAVSRSFHTVLMVEWSPKLAAGLDAEERGQRMSRLAKALKRRATNGIVIVYAPEMDRALQLVSFEADQTVWLVPSRRWHGRRWRWRRGRRRSGRCSESNAIEPNGAANLGDGREPPDIVRTGWH